MLLSHGKKTYIKMLARRSKVNFLITRKYIEAYAIPDVVELFLGTRLYGPRREKTCLRWFANNKGADQPILPHSLINAFGIHLIEGIISELATSESSIFCS